MPPLPTMSTIRLVVFSVMLAIIGALWAVNMVQSYRLDRAVVRAEQAEGTVASVERGVSAAREADKDLSNTSVDEALRRRGWLSASPAAPPLPGPPPAEQAPLAGMPPVVLPPLPAPLVVSRVAPPDDAKPVSSEPEPSSSAAAALVPRQATRPTSRARTKPSSPLSHRPSSLPLSPPRRSAPAPPDWRDAVFLRS